MAIGASSLISFSDGSGDQQNTAIDIVKEQIKFLLLTNKGEIVAEPDFGADLIHFVFRPLDDFTKELIKITCTAEIGLNLPYVNVTSVEFFVTDPGKLQFTLGFELIPGWEEYVDVILGTPS